MTPDQHWRAIEAELVSWAKGEGCYCDEDIFGDRRIIENISGLNLTRLAHHLAQSFVPRTVTQRVS